MGDVRFPKSALKQGGGQNPYDNNRKTYYGPEPTDTSGRGGPKAMPNGGSTRLVESPEGKMPRSQGKPVEQSGPLPIPSAKMPRNMSGQRQTIPYRR
jgi:hypothetical protein